MAKKNLRVVDESSWREWKEACSIENCEHGTTVSQLFAFGRNRLGHALRRYSPETADLYCDPDGRNPRGAWLKVEQYLYPGAPGTPERSGKAYKDRLAEGCSTITHFEAALTLKIQREITRWILADEGFDIVQKTDAETGHKKYVVTRAQNLSEEEMDDALAQLDGCYHEPCTEEDEDAILRAAEYQARKVWQALDGEERSTQRLLLACLLNNIWDMKAVLASGLVSCRQSQLYKERKAVLRLLDSTDWGPGCLEAGQRAYMTRHLIPLLKKICADWLTSVENSKTRIFIETAGCDTRP